MASKHRRILLKNLKKAHTPAAKAKAAATRRANAGTGISEPKTRSSRTSRTRTPRSSSTSSHQEGIPEPPSGFVVETVTYRRT